MIIGDDLDLCGNKLINARMDVYMGSPLITGVGSFGFNEAFGRFEVFDGTVWHRYITHIDLLNYSLVGHSHSYEDLKNLPVYLTPFLGRQDNSTHFIDIKE